MGSGKTYWGRRLSERYQIPVIDLDTYVEEHEGCSIEDIFLTKGEEKFRQLETEALKSLCKTHQDLIVSTGGGTPAFHQNMEYMLKQGIVIYLQAEAEWLAHRMQDEYQHRPLLLQSEPDTRLQIIRDLLKKRIPFYEMAHYQFPVSDLNDTIFDPVFKSYV